jgi:hypothetical protein
MRDPRSITRYGSRRQAGAYVAALSLLVASASCGSVASHAMSGAGLGATNMYTLGAGSSGGMRLENSISMRSIHGWNAALRANDMGSIDDHSLTPKTNPDVYELVLTRIFVTPADTNASYMPLEYVSASASWGCTSISRSISSANSLAIETICSLWRGNTRRQAVNCSSWAVRSRASAASFSSMAARPLAALAMPIAAARSAWASASAVWAFSASTDAEKACPEASRALSFAANAMSKASLRRPFDRWVISPWHTPARAAKAISPMTPSATNASQMTPPQRSSAVPYTGLSTATKNSSASPSTTRSPQNRSQRSQEEIALSSVSSLALFTPLGRRHGGQGRLWWLPLLGVPAAVVIFWLLGGFHG